MPFHGQIVIDVLGVKYSRCSDSSGK